MRGHHFAGLAGRTHHTGLAPELDTPSFRRNVFLEIPFLLLADVGITVPISRQRYSINRPRVSLSR